MSKYANDMDMMGQALLAQMQRERDDAIKASMQDMATVESLRAELETTKRERDELEGRIANDSSMYELRSELAKCKRERDEWKKAYELKLNENGENIRKLHDIATDWQVTQQELITLRQKIAEAKPVAWIANDGSAVHLSYWSDLDTPLYSLEGIKT